MSQGVNGLGVDVLTIKGELIGNKGDVAVIGEMVEKLDEPLQVLFVDLGELAVDGIPQLVVVIGDLAICVPSSLLLS